jgi:hypothetical protein
MAGDPLMDAHGTQGFCHGFDKPQLRNTGLMGDLKPDLYLSVLDQKVVRSQPRTKVCSELLGN